MKGIDKWLVYWLRIGLIFIFFQIVLGGITRLTGSGLSITKWDIVTGTMFPLTEESWNKYFNLYKDTPQYQKINNGISISQFKFIFFWEYIHRLWARLMGFVFILPLIYFLVKRKIENWLLIRLIIVFFLAAFVASLGWIMVASGLIERPWVNAFKLAFHLCAAILLLSYLLWTYLLYFNGNIKSVKSSKLLIGLVLLIFFQLFLGGVMSGMKAAIVAPTWPFINSVFIPSEFFNWSIWRDFFFNDYELNASSSLIIQFMHRMIAYIIFCVVIIVVYKQVRKDKFKIQKEYIILFSFILLQILLGIFTLVFSVGKIPLLLGALHQFVGVSCYCFVLYLYFMERHSLKSI